MSTKGRHGFAFGILALVALVVVALAATGCGHHGEEASTQQAARAVATITTQSTSTEIGAEVPGIIRPIREARIAPKIMSKVAEVRVHEGDRVRRGEVLVRLESRDLAAGVAQSAAAVAAARAGEQQAQTALKMQRVASSVDVQQAEAALRSAQANLAKVQHGPRPEQKQQAQEAVTTAKAGLASAQAQLDILREGARKQERAQAAQSVVRAQQAVDAAHQGVIVAQAALKTATADHNRMKALAAQGVIPQQRLDHADLAYQQAQAQLAQAKSGEAQAKAALDQAQQQQSLVVEGPRTQRIKQAEEAVAQAQAGVKQAQLNLDMANKGGRTEDVASAQAAVTQAEQGLRNARAAQARDKIKEENVRVAQASVGQAKAGEQSASVMLSYSTITAPFDGVVTARFVDPGSMATPGVPMIVVADDSEYRLEATVPAKLANYLHVGSPAKVRVDALQAEWPVKIVEMVPSADPMSHSVQVKARLPKDGRIYSGLFGRLVVSTGSRKAIVVPEKAVWRQGSLAGVFVIAESTAGTPGKAQLRMVQLGATRDGTVEINSGLKPGEVIAADATGLADGMAVQAQGAPGAGKVAPR